MERSYRETVQYTKDAHKLLNDRLFDGKLSTPFINYCNINKGEDGKCYNGAYIRRDEMKKHMDTMLAEEPCAILFDSTWLEEIVNTFDTEKQRNEEIVETLLHEMIHQYCDENGISDVENGLHTEAFGNAAWEHGLECMPEETDKGTDYSFTLMREDDPFYGMIWEELNATPPWPWESDI